MAWIRLSNSLLGASVVLGAAVGLWHVLTPNEDYVDENVSLQVSNPRRDSGPSCGADVLYVISKLAGLNPSLKEINTSIGLSTKGASLLDLQNTARLMGFAVDAKQLNFPTLCCCLLQPNAYAILHLKKGHFVAAVAASGTPQKRFVRLIDTSSRISDVSADELESNGWEGVALLLRH